MTPKQEEKGFRNLGEQLMAVYRAAIPGGRIDERLSTRAAMSLAVRAVPQKRLST
jgi:hypothetical protein